MAKTPTLTVIAGGMSQDRHYEETHRTASVRNAISAWLETMAGAIVVGAAIMVAAWYFASLILSLGLPQ